MLPNVRSLARGNRGGALRRDVHPAVVVVVVVRQLRPARHGRHALGRIRVCGASGTLASGSPTRSRGRRREEEEGAHTGEV